MLLEVMMPGLLGLGSVGAQELPKGAIHVEVFGPSGERIPNPEVHLYTPDREREVAKLGQSPTIRDVPYGEYLLVAPNGSLFGKREIVVNARDLWVRLGLEFTPGDRKWPGGAITVSGEIKPPPSKANEWWVRIEGVFLHVSRESPVSPGGQFSAGLFPMGTYLVQVFEGAKLRRTETIEIDNTQVNVRLTIAFP